MKAFWLSALLCCSGFHFSDAIAQVGDVARKEFLELKGTSENPVLRHHISLWGLLGTALDGVEGG